MTRPCLECGSENTSKLANSLVFCGDCNHKTPYDCPECGFLAESSEALPTTGTGHADVLFLECPDCGEVNGNLGWSL